jgi:hypothetical protein
MCESVLLSVLTFISAVCVFLSGVYTKEQTTAISILNKTGSH